MDRISELPDFIVHHILACVYNWDCTGGKKVQMSHIIRMIILSKKWFDLTASFPILDFKIRSFDISRKSFFKYVEYTTSRFCRQNVTAHKFELITTLLEPEELDVVNMCLELVLKKGMKVLVVDITNLLDVPVECEWNYYRLPSIGLSASVLESLTISRCELPSMVDVVKFKSLIYLKLDNVWIDNEMIIYLTTSCPLLQVFHIKYSPGFKNFVVYGHPHLQEVSIYYITQVERIDIEAPKLSNLTIVSMDERGAPRMNVASCKKLTTVTYSGPLPNSNSFIDFLSNFPFIENLYLTTKCNNLKLSSPSLRTLMLRSNCDVEQIEFSTPRLVVFNYSCNAFFIWPEIIDTYWRRMVWQSIYSKGYMQFYPDSLIDTHWFQKLRLFFSKNNGFKVINLYINATVSRKFIDLEKLKATELPPYDLEHVELQVRPFEESVDNVAFVDAVLWCCRPRSLTLRSSSPYDDYDYGKQRDVLNFTYEKLREQEDQEHTTIQIVWPSSSGIQKMLMDMKSMYPEGNAISYIKENDTLFY